jgi:hypothetical protein
MVRSLKMAKKTVKLLEVTSSKTCGEVIQKPMAHIHHLLPRNNSMKLTTASMEVLMRMMVQEPLMEEELPIRIKLNSILELIIKLPRV